MGNRWLWDAEPAGGKIANFDLPSHFDDIILEHEIAMETWRFVPKVQRNRISSLSPSLLMRRLVSRNTKPSYAGSNPARIPLNDQFHGICGIGSNSLGEGFS
jgi:hypothetical protein